MSPGRTPHQPDSRFGVATRTAVEVVSSTALWFLVGRLLDLVADTGPWLTFAGVCLGCWVGLYLGWSGARQREHDEHAHVDVGEGSDGVAQARSTPEPSG